MDQVIDPTNLHIDLLTLAMPNSPIKNASHLAMEGVLFSGYWACAAQRSGMTGAITGTQRSQPRFPR
ncbi:hypothetical protein [Aeromonas dhakensis]|uniref:hypothetical protein n=1 Tax=Aeromonas dhakensis TaxID=196024 RepID=UPI003F78CAA8